MLFLSLTNILQISASSLRRLAGRIIIKKPEEVGQIFSCRMITKVVKIYCQCLTLTLRDMVVFLEEKLCHLVFSAGRLCAKLHNRPQGAHGPFLCHFYFHP